MAPSRRRARDQLGDDDSDHVLSLREETSNFQHKKKRARVSTQEPPRHHPQHAASSGPESDSDHDGNIEPRDNDAPPMTQYERIRDEDSDEQENVEEEDQHCTQRIQLRQTQAIHAENRVAENGIIESIECVNFMCHERLTVKLGPLLNFVVGENGSGKSAVLTAITICLGGKASATNRGGSLKALIKEGRDTARLTVVLKNEGDGAYKPDLYGDKIIIERRFSRNGSPSFKIKSAMEKMISSKKGDLDEITEYFALQVDNPLNILSQDNARQFLNASSASQKYSLWFQGVNLQALDQHYRIIQDFVTDNDVKHRAFKTTVEALEKKNEEASRLVQIADKNTELKEKHRLLRHKLVWAQVVEAEKVLERYQADLIQIDAELRRRQDEIQPLKEEHKKLADKTKEAHEGTRIAREGAEEFEREVEEAKTALDGAVAIRSSLHADERNAKAQLDALKKKLDSKEAAVRKEEKRLEEVDGGEMGRQNEFLRQAESKLKDVSFQKAETSKATEDMVERVAAAYREVREAAHRIGLKDDEIKKSQDRLRTLGKGNNDIYLNFHPRTRELLAAIARDGGFREKPVGPIGLHAQLTEPKWALIIDKYLGNNLEAYVVTSHADNMRLREMMKRFGMASNIITTSKEPLDTTGKEPAAGINTILRVLKFDSTLCRDPLVIGNSIEQTVLIENRTEAQDFMFRDDGTQPRNVKACITLNDGKRGEGLMLLNNRDGARTEPMGAARSAARLRIDDASQLPLEQETLNALQQERETLKASLERAKRAHTALQNEKRNMDGKLRSLETQDRQQRAAIQKIQDQITALEGGDTKLQGLIEEREDAQEEYEQGGRQFGDVFARKLEHEPLVKRAQDNLEAKRKQQQQWDAIIKKADIKYERLKDATSLALQRLNAAFEDVDAKILSKQTAEQKIQRQEQEVEEMSGSAEEVCPERVAIREHETYRGLEQQYKGITRQLENRYNQQGKSDDDIRQEYLDAKKELKEAQTGFANCKRDLDGLKKCLEQRAVKWRQFRRSISSYTRVEFESLLTARQFRGRVALDHKNRRLVVEVEPDETRQDANGRNTKTLSGGEKSYTSICLLLAIWEAMGSPLRCLDEFDVFMDNVNRAISTKLLIRAARMSVGRQYIFITPNAIEGARSQLGDDVKIHRLTDPRQKRLDEMVQEQ